MSYAYSLLVYPQDVDADAFGIPSSLLRLFLGGYRVSGFSVQPGTQEGQRGPFRPSGKWE